MSDVEDVVSLALLRGYQVHPDALEFLRNSGDLNCLDVVSEAISRKQISGDEDYTITSKNLIGVVGEIGPAGNNVSESDESADFESYEVVRDIVRDSKLEEGITGYKLLFESRFKKFIELVSKRPDSHRIRRVQDVKASQDKQPVKVAGLLLRRKVRRKSVEITIDDESGNIDAVVSGSTMIKKVNEMLLDQLVVIDVEYSKWGKYMVKDLYSPDVPDRVMNISKKNVYGVFISDIHVGCKTFLAEAFNKFLLWLSDSDDDIVKKIRYLVIAGDVVDGVGIYPRQDLELEEKSVLKQYEMFAGLLRKLPNSIKIFVSPGNHDATRQALPQFAISRKYAPDLYEMENVTMLGNPAVIRLHGVNVLVYHGQSLVDVVASTPGLSFDRPANAMKSLLKARHLAPMYGGGVMVAPEREDRLVIDEVPDIFHCGHIHIVDSMMYKNTLLLNSGTWQSQTKYQQNMGIVPVTGIAPVVNLSTLDVIAKRFA